MFTDSQGMPIDAHAIICIMRRDATQYLGAISMTDYLTGRGEHDAFHYSSDSEWDRAEACERGAMNPDRAWILTDRDVWHKNPYYAGPAVPHPEEDY